MSENDYRQKTDEDHVTMNLLRREADEIRLQIGDK
jgi:hypothetical protein